MPIKNNYCERLGRLGCQKSISMGPIGLVHRNFMGAAIKIGYERLRRGPKREPREL